MKLLSLTAACILPILSLAQPYPSATENDAIIYISPDTGGSVYAWLSLDKTPEKAEELADAFAASLGSPESSADYWWDDEEKEWVAEGINERWAPLRAGSRQGDISLERVRTFLADNGYSHVQVEVAFPSAPWIHIAPPDFVPSTDDEQEYDARFPLANPLPDLHVTYGLTRNGFRFAIVSLLVPMTLFLLFVWWVRVRALHQCQVDPGGSCFWAMIAHAWSERLFFFLFSMALLFQSLTSGLYYLVGSGNYQPAIILTVWLGIPLVLGMITRTMLFAVYRRFPGATWRLRALVMPFVYGYALAYALLLTVIGAFSQLYGGDFSVFLLILMGGGVASLYLYTKYTFSLGFVPQAVTEGELPARWEAVATRTGLKMASYPISILYLENCPMANAFAQNDNSLLVTDYLLSLLTRREVDAIMAHEAAHMALKHALIRLQNCIIPIVLAVIICTKDDVFPHGWNGTSFSVLLAAAALYYLSVFAKRRRREFAADAKAIATGCDPEALKSALAKSHRANFTPSRWTWWTRFFMSHPPLEDRLRRIEKTAQGRSQDEAESPAEKDTEVEEYYDVPASSSRTLSFSDRFKAKMGLNHFLLQWMVPSTVSALFLVACARYTRLFTQYPWVFYLLAAFVSLLTIRLMVILPRRALFRRLEILLRKKLGNDSWKRTSHHFVGFSPSGETLCYGAFLDWEMGFLRFSADELIFEGEHTRFRMPRAWIERMDTVRVTQGLGLYAERVRIAWKSQPEEDAQQWFITAPADTYRLWKSGAADTFVRQALHWMASGGEEYGRESGENAIPPAQPIQAKGIPYTLAITPRRIFFIMNLHFLLSLAIASLFGFPTLELGAVNSVLAGCAAAAGVLLFLLPPFIWARRNS